MTIIDAIRVEPDKFLLDYKIIIFAFIILIASLIMRRALKKRKMLLVLLAISDIIATIGYIILRIFETDKYGYLYLFESNKSFDESIAFILGMIIIYFILFLISKIIQKLRRNKNGSNI